MKVLWISNVLLPEACEKLGYKVEVKGTGGWILALANSVHEKSDIQIHIAAITELVQELTTLKGEHFTYHAIPRGKGDVSYNVEYEGCYKRIVDEIQPDVVHIHGSEMPHALAALKVCGKEKTVVSVQGLVSVIARYNNGGISVYEALRNLTFHDIIRGGIIKNQKEMYMSGKFEVSLLKEIKYVIGRTSFDKQHIWAINPQAKYFHCDELLRDEFYYSREWKYETCCPHSIFMSQSAFPIKGIHKVIEALGIVVKHYPDVQLKIAGQDIICNSGGFKNRIRLTSYGRLVRGLIMKHNLSDRIKFTGPLNASEMIEQYLNSNLFICSSSIENSPNSLAEAQVLGVPCLGSYAGGIPDMMKGDEEQLYRFEEVEMLAYKICNIFEMCDRISTSDMRQNALKRHDRDMVVKSLVKIYTEIANE